jgi:16S rRNA (adenine1518-N6/adenine1519-N6)-dimethyltransferase
MANMDIVNDKDEIIETKDSSKVDYSKDIIRCSLIILENDKKEIGLQLRAKDDEDYPGCYDCTAGGGVDAGETYEEAAVRELSEELGLNTIPLTKVGKDFFTYENGEKEFMATFKGAYSNEKMTLDGSEVAEVTFYPIKEIQQMLLNEKLFHPECCLVLKKYFKIS